MHSPYLIHTSFRDKLLDLFFLYLFRTLNFHSSFLLIDGNRLALIGWLEFFVVFFVGKYLHNWAFVDIRHHEAHQHVVETLEYPVIGIFDIVSRYQDVLCDLLFLSAIRVGHYISDFAFIPYITVFIKENVHNIAFADVSNLKVSSDHTSEHIVDSGLGFRKGHRIYQVLFRHIFEQTLLVFLSIFYFTQKPRPHCVLFIIRGAKVIPIDLSPNSWKGKEHASSENPVEV